jgi:hypothetical protein
MPKRPDYDAINFYLLLDVVQQLAYIRFTLRQQENNMAAIDDALTALETEVTELTDAKDATLALLARILQELKDAIAAGGNSAAQVARVQAVIAAVDADQQALADAVAANTVPPTPA